MPTIALGRNCSISVGGSALTGVRSVSVNRTRQEIEVPLYSDGETYCLPGNRSLSIEIETITAEDAAILVAAIDARTPVSVVSTNASARFIVTSCAASEPLDDVVVYTATLKRTFNA